MTHIIDGNSRIVSILVSGAYVDLLTGSLVEQFKEKQVMLWQDKNLYQSCKRFQLGFGLDLNVLLEEFIDEFDVLIIDKLRDSVNAEDKINFIRKTTKDERYKNKQ